MDIDNIRERVAGKVTLVFEDSNYPEKDNWKRYIKGILEDYVLHGEMANTQPEEVSLIFGMSLTDLINNTETSLIEKTKLGINKEEVDELKEEIHRLNVVIEQLKQSLTESNEKLNVMVELLPELTYKVTNIETSIVKQTRSVENEIVTLKNNLTRLTEPVNTVLPTFSGRI